MKFIAFVTLLVGAAAFAADESARTTLYKSVDADGHTVYSDRPPSDAKTVRTMQFDNLPSSPLAPSTLAFIEQLRERSRRNAASAPAEAPSGAVNLFTASWCVHCKRAKAYLANKGIAFTEFDIESENGAMAYVVAGGARGVPLLLTKDKRVQGFSTGAYDAVFVERK